MALKNIVGFETGDATECVATSGTFQIQSGTVRSGTYSLRINPTGTGTGYVELRSFATTGAQTSSIGTNVYACFYLRIAIAPAIQSEPVMALFDNGGNFSGELRLNSSRALVMYDRGSSLLGTGSTILNLDTWYRIELYCQGGSVTGTSFELRINGTGELSGTGNFATSFQNARFGKTTNRNSQSVDLYYDDLAISDSNWCNGGSILLLKPDGNGGSSGWTGGFGDVDDFPHDGDTTHLSTSSAGILSTFQVSSATSVGIGGTIVGVKPLGIVAAPGSAAFQLRVQSGSSASETTNYSPGATYRTISKIVETSPSTGLAWTVSELDSVEVGIESNQASAHKCSALGVVVYFQPSGSSSVEKDFGIAVGWLTSIEPSSSLPLNWNSELTEESAFPLLWHGSLLSVLGFPLNWLSQIEATRGIPLCWDGESFLASLLFHLPPRPMTLQLPVRGLTFSLLERTLTYQLPKRPE